MFYATIFLLYHEATKTANSHLPIKILAKLLWILLDYLPKKTRLNFCISHQISQQPVATWI